MTPHLNQRANVAEAAHFLHYSRGKIFQNTSVPAFFRLRGFYQKQDRDVFFFIKNAHRKNILMVYSDFLARNQISIE